MRVVVSVHRKLFAVKNVCRTTPDSQPGPLRLSPIESREKSRLKQVYYCRLVCTWQKCFILGLQGALLVRVHLITGGVLPILKSYGCVGTKTSMRRASAQGRNLYLTAKIHASEMGPAVHLCTNNCTKTQGDDQ